MAYDVVVIGGGLTGLAAAYFLSRDGARVAVVERQAPGAGASGAAAGMLTPGVEMARHEPLLQLGLQSLAMWPALVESLAEETGLGPELVRSGAILVARDEAHEACLTDLAGRLAARGWYRAVWLDRSELARQVPGLAPDLPGGLLFPADCQVQPPRVVAALQVACVARGVDLLLGREVHAVCAEGNRVTGVKTSAGPVAAATVVLAGGAFSGALAPLGLNLPIFPVKGQIVAVQGAGLAVGPWVTELRPIFLPDVYCVPKRDGRIVLGATEEPEAGFDTAVTLGGVTALGKALAAALPKLGRAPVVATWSGLRPGTPDRMPIVGPAPGWEGLIIATGQYRYGVLLGPVIGQAVAAWAMGNDPGEAFVPFHPTRFQ